MRSAPISVALACLLGTTHVSTFAEINLHASQPGLVHVNNPALRNRINDLNKATGELQQRLNQQREATRIQVMDSGGLAVIFGESDLELTPAQTAEVKVKLSQAYVNGQIGWSIQVFSKKGDAAEEKSAFRRASHLRTVLLQNNVPAQFIAMKVLLTPGENVPSNRVFLLPVHDPSKVNREQTQDV